MYYVYAVLVLAINVNPQPISLDRDRLRLAVISNVSIIERPILSTQPTEQNVATRQLYRWTDIRSVTQLVIWVTDRTCKFTWVVGYRRRMDAQAEPALGEGEQGPRPGPRTCRGPKIKICESHARNAAVRGSPR